MTFTIPKTIIELSAAHFYKGGTHHGGTTESANWPWWQVFHVSRVKISGAHGGRRVWVYTPWGALHADLTVYREAR